jgi:hypothetical protein
MILYCLRRACNPNFRGAARVGCPLKEHNRMSHQVAVAATRREPIASLALKGKTIPWRDRPLHSMQDASHIAGVSKASLYRLASEGRLTLKRLAGRTLVETKSLMALVENAEDWTPATRADRARAARAERARAAWQ